MAFPENATGVLIGANNACKPTLLNAIRLVLSGASTYNFVPGKYDFFHDAEAEPWHWALRSFQETQGVRVCSERPMRNETSFFIVVGGGIRPRGGVPNAPSNTRANNGFPSYPCFLERDPESAPCSRNSYEYTIPTDGCHAPLDYCP